MKAPESKPTKNGSQNPPLAPFNLTSAFELAALAALLSKGKDPAKYLPKAASLWAQARQYNEDLRFLFYGEKALKMPAWEVWSLGGADEWMDVKTACAKYSLGKQHLRDLLKTTLPPNLFEHFWKPPISKIELPKALLDRLEHLRNQKRSARAQKAVKPKQRI